jgi:protein-tyrosine-phosphatase
MDQEILNVLFLCTGNSARSIMAESILNSLGRAKFNAFSAGSRPAGSVNPLALELLQKNRLPTEGLRSKDWNEFSQPGAPFMHFVFTVCDQAAAAPCPAWPGQPMTAHWGVTDPAAVQGNVDDKRKSLAQGVHGALSAHLPVHQSTLWHFEQACSQTEAGRYRSHAMISPREIKAELICFEFVLDTAVEDHNKPRRIVVR